MKHQIVVAAVDEDECKRLDLGYPLLSCDAVGKLGDFEGGARVQLSDLHLNALCVLATSPGGLESVELLRDRFRTELGAEPPLLVDLTETAPGERRACVLTRIIDALLQERADAARRQVELLRDVCHLREAHEDLHRSFALLEGFVREADLDHRQLTRELPPAINARSVVISSGTTLHQRLPRKSSGISDIGLHVARPPADAQGQLLVALLVTGSGEKLADWTLQGPDLEPGWVRLPLERAVGPDDKTVDIRLEWTGATPLELDWSLRHPDPRFCIRADATDSPEQSEDRVLALRLWTYIPGCAAPLPADGASSDQAGLTVLPRNRLAAAQNLNRGNEFTRFLEEDGVLIVHPQQNDLSAALLSEAVGPMTTRVTADIKSLSEKADDIEFAMIIAPPDARLHPDGLRRWPGRRRGTVRKALEGLMGAENVHKSEWYRLGGNERGRFDVILPTPPRTAMDLYLITRMSDPGKPPLWAWAAFSSVTLSREGN